MCLKEIDLRAQTILGSIVSLIEGGRGLSHSRGISIKKSVHVLPFIKRFGFFLFSLGSYQKPIFFSLKFRDLPLPFGNFPSF